MGTTSWSTSTAGRSPCCPRASSPISWLESAYATSPLIRQIFVYGNSARAYPLAVVVLTDTFPRKAWRHRARLRTALYESLRTVARESQLQPYEIPYATFIVETEPFTMENGLLSDIP
ncbi:hypothetical protein [Streptomyces sp. KL116D]|uniref:AMP-binding enzyme n=1 Tax=Streptomyces sp. KL116D TaxID=3045152 RepID=UPI003556F155